MALNLKQDQDIEKATDSLGGGGVLDSNIYPFQIKTIYLGSSKTAAVSATVVGKLENGSEFKTTQWIISGNSKGNKPYYERNGKKYPLPGYTVIDDICQIVTGTSLGDIEMEEKTVKIYDFELGKEVPTEVDCICDVEDGEVFLAVIKQLEDKTEDDGAGGRSVIVGESRETNEVAKVLNADGATLLEVKDAAEIVWKDKWLTKNEGNVRDKRAKGTGAAGAPQKASTAKKMFS
jgi:hypothetical protein